MCTVTLNIDEALARKANPALTSMEAITRWAQQLVDKRIADLLEIRNMETLKPYTIEEINARIDQSLRDSAAGLGQESEEMFRELEEEFAREEELEMAEAV